MRNEMNSKVKIVGSAILYCVVVPILVLSAMGWMLDRYNPVTPNSLPKPVKAELSVQVDSGERWYNPFSWQNEEMVSISTAVAQDVASQISVQQASAAQANAVAYTNKFGVAMLTMCGVGIAGLMAFGVMKQTSVKDAINQVRALESSGSSSGFRNSRNSRNNNSGSRGDEIGDEANEPYPARTANA